MSTVESILIRKLIVSIFSIPCPFSNHSQTMKNISLRKKKLSLRKFYF